MLDQLHNQLGSASYPSTWHKSQASGLASRAVDELAALGVTLTVDASTATTVAGAVAIAKSTVAAQAVSATFSANQKQQALGKLDSLAAQLGSLGLT